jgi:hypothetical protein
VSLEISSAALISGKRAAITSARGTYVFLELPGGKYKLTASLPNFKTAILENIEISAGSAINFDVVMEVGAIEQTVLVSATGPIVDAKSSTVDSKLDRAMMDKLPTSRDAFYDLSLTTPGMFEVGASGTDMPSPTAYGGSQNENVFLVNGVNTTNPRGANWGSMVQVNYNAVEEVRVVALGSKAEYGSFSGATVDVLTKSGSNRFHGSLSFYSQLAKPKSNQPAPGADLGRSWLYMPEGVNLLSQTKQDWEGNATLGGAILKDKIWFYSAFDYFRSDSLTPYWPLTARSWSGFGDLKISAEPFTNHRAWVSYHHEANDFDGGNWGAQGTDPTVTYGARSYINSISAQWQWLPSDKAIFTAKYLGFWNHDEQYIPDDAPAWPAYVNWWKITVGAIQVNGAFPWIEAFQANRQTVQADVAYYAENFIGEHDIKFGVQYTIGQGNVMDGYLFGYGNFTYPGGPSSGSISNMINYSWYAYTDGMRFYNNKYYRNPVLTVRQGTQAGLFLDDQWNPFKRLTVNLGLRFDVTRARYGEGAVYEVPDTPNQLNEKLTLLRKRKGTGNVFDFQDISPRLGLTYLLTGDGKTVARASFGRYYMPLTLEALRRFGPDLPDRHTRRSWYKIPWDVADQNGDGIMDPAEVEYWTRQIRGMTPYEYEDLYDPLSWTLNVGKGLKNQFTNVLTLNLERELIKDFSISASYIYRHTGNLQAQVPTNELTGQEWEYEMMPYTTQAGVDVQLYSILKRDYDGLGDGFTGSDVQWIRDHNKPEVRNMGSYFGKKVQRTYQAFQLVLNKRFSDRWQALGSFVYSSSDGAASRSIHQDFNVEASEFYDDQWLSGLNQLVNNLEGPLPFTPKYEFKLSGSYRVPVVELDLGFRFRMHSGRGVWSVENVSKVAETWMSEIPSDFIVQPSGGGLSSNIISIDPKKPFYMPAQSILDFRVEKAFTLGNKGTLHFVLDAFNVFNVATPTFINTGYWGFGEVSSFVAPRKFRFNILFEF